MKVQNKHYTELMIAFCRGCFVFLRGICYVVQTSFKLCQPSCCNFLRVRIVIVPLYHQPSIVLWEVKEDFLHYFELLKKTDLFNIVKINSGYSKNKII